MVAELQFWARETRVPKKKVRAKQQTWKKLRVKLRYVKNYIRAQRRVTKRNSAAKGLIFILAFGCLNHWLSWPIIVLVVDCFNLCLNLWLSEPLAVLAFGCLGLLLSWPLTVLVFSFPWPLTFCYNVLFRKLLIITDYVIVLVEVYTIWIYMIFIHCYNIMNEKHLDQTFININY